MTLRIARMLGFHYDEHRDAYVLRLVGDRVGPVLRTSPPVDQAAAALEWTEAMDELAERKRRTGRFKRDSRRARREVVKR